MKIRTKIVIFAVILASLGAYKQINIPAKIQSIVQKAFNKKEKIAGESEDKEWLLQYEDKKGGKVMLHYFKEEQGEEMK